jgi:hypothetical protein
MIVSLAETSSSHWLLRPRCSGCYSLGGCGLLLPGLQPNECAMPIFANWFCLDEGRFADQLLRSARSFAL